MISHMSYSQTPELSLAPSLLLYSQVNYPLYAMTITDPYFFPVHLSHNRSVLLIACLLPGLTKRSK